MYTVEQIVFCLKMLQFFLGEVNFPWNYDSSEFSEAVRCGGKIVILTGPR